LGVLYTFIVAPMTVKFGMDSSVPHVKFYRYQCNVSLLRGEKPQNCPLINLIPVLCTVCSAHCSKQCTMANIYFKMDNSQCKPTSIYTTLCRLC